MDQNDLLQEKRDKVKAADEIRARMLENGGAWLPDDEKKFDELLASVEDLSQKIEKIGRLDSAQRSLETTEEIKQRRSEPRIHLAQSMPTSRRPAATSEDRSLAIQGWAMAGNHVGLGNLTERHYQAAERVGMSLNQNAITLRLAPLAPSSTDADAWREWEQRVIQVAVESPDDGGSNTVPDEMMRPLERALLAFGGMRQVSTIIRTTTGSDLPIPTNDDTGNTGAILAESTEHTELDVTFGQLVLNAFKYTSRRVNVTVEYLQDNAINAVAFLGELLGERIGRITNDHFTTGTGSSQPRGVVVAATDSTVDFAGTLAPTYRELMDIKHSVDPAYRDRGARWMFHDGMLKEIKKIVIPGFSGDTAGQPLWRPGLTVSEPNTIDGDPYTVNQSMAAPAVGESPAVQEKTILYGDFSKYLIRDVRDFTLVRLDERYAELGQVAFLAFSRHDGDLLTGGDPIVYAEAAAS